MKYYDLSKEEEELLQSLDEGELVSVKETERTTEIARLQNIASNSLNRARNINIRLSERDLQKLKARAVEKGIPYQTLVASVLHQYSSK